ncbi:MAG: PspC domain-containing protein [Propionibacteriales bacterium]|nr:PspC domain-containing protein [Propionibacteriales bacterium]
MQPIWEIRRATGDAKIAGLCGGVAAKWGIDPLLVRVAAVVLALSAGLGAVLYAAGWALLPKQGENDSLLGRRVPGARRIPRNAWLIIVAVVALTVMVTVGSAFPIGTGPVIAIGAAWYFFFHRPKQKKLQQDRSRDAVGQGATTFDDASATWQQRISQHLTPRPTNPSGPPAPMGPTGPVSSADRFTEPAGWAHQLPPTVPAAVRMGHTDTSTFFAHPDPAGLYPTGSGTKVRTAVATPASTKRLTKVAVVAALVILGGFGVLDALGALDIGLATYASAALLIAAVTLIASAWMGRPRGLVVITAILAVLSIGTQTQTTPPGQFMAPMMLSGPVSQMPKSHTVSTGDYVFDFEAAEVDADTRITIDAELGTVRVLLPAEGNVRVVTSNELGEVRLPTGTVSGADQNPTYERIDDPGAPVLLLEVSIELGTAEVIEP